MATVAASWMPQAHQRASTAPYTSTTDYHSQQYHHQQQRHVPTPASTSSATSASASSAPAQSSSSSRRSTSKNSSESSNNHNQSASAATTSSSSSSQHCDRFYGHRELAELCERVILALFSCPLDSTASSVETSTASPSTSKPAPRLAEFVAYALHRTRLPLAVTHQALFLLKRLKSRFPAARGSSGHRLFISALMLASKSSCDDTYSNKSWTIVGQGLFSLREVNQMERELFGYLGFRVNVEPEELDEFVFGLQQGRIHAPTEAVSPAMGLNYGFDSTAMEHSASSPSVASEPAFNGHDYVGHNGYSSQSRQSQHPNGVFNTRASFSGYPSVQSAPSTSSSQPMSHTDSTMDTGAYRSRESSASSSQSSSSRYDQSRLTVAPSVPMQGQYYSSPSAAVSTYACARGLSASSDGGASYVPSPFGSQVSSGSTTPESPTSQLDSPPDCDWTQAAIVDHVAPSHQHHHHRSVGGVDTSEQPAGTYEREHEMYTGKQQQHRRLRFPSTAAAAASRAAHQVVQHNQGPHHHPLYRS